MDAAEARRSSASSSPKFEFWLLHPNLATSLSCADKLFSDGIHLPLLLHATPTVSPLLHATHAHQPW